MTEREYYLGFALISGIGPKRLNSLLKTFKTAKNAWEASELELKSAGLGNVFTQQFINFRKEFNSTSDELKIVQLLENEGLSFDEIVRLSKLNSSVIASLISMLEIKGIIARSDGFFQLTT